MTKTANVFVLKCHRSTARLPAEQFNSHLSRNRVPLSCHWHVNRATGRLVCTWSADADATAEQPSGDRLAA